MDGSGSIGSSNFQTALNFMSSLVGYYDIGLSKTRVGVVVYSTIVYPRIRLNRYSNVGQLKAAIKGLSYPSRGTNTGAAIDYVRQNSFTTGFGARGLSEGVARVLIVATDGRSGDDVIAPSNRARNDGISLFSVGIGSGINDMQLEDIADRPDRVFRVGSFSRLLQITFIIRTSSCKANAVVKPGTPVSTSIPAGKLVFFKTSLDLSRPLSISFTEIGGKLVIYASYTHTNPGPNLHDFVWHIEGGKRTVTTPTSTKDQKSGTRDLYLAVQNNGSTPATVKVDVTRAVSSNVADIRSEITTIASAGRNSQTYNCSANCTCPDARVSWEKQSFDRSIQSSATVTTDPDGLSSILQLNTSTGDHYGRYFCVIRSPHVIGSENVSLALSVPCRNGGTNVNVHICRCPSGWSGLQCEIGEHRIYMYSE